MAINLPRYADDDAVDLVNGAYSQAMDEIEKNLDKASTDITAAKTKADAASAAAEQAKTKADAASATAEQAKTSVIGQKSVIDKLRGDVDGLIAGGGEATVPIATTSKAGIVKPDGSTISVQVDGTVSLSDNSVNSTKLAAGGVTEDKLSDGVKAKLNKPAVESYTLPVATAASLGGVKSGGDINVGSTGTMTVGTASVTETKLSADVQAKLNKETGLTEVPDNSVTSAKIVNGAVTETKLSSEVQTKLNSSAPSYSLPVATTAVLGGVKAGSNINIDSSGLMTIGSGVIEESQLTSSVQDKLNKTGQTISAKPITINKTSYAADDCYGFKFGDLIILNIHGTNLSSDREVRIGGVEFEYSPRIEVSGPCICGDGIGLFLIRGNGDIIINPKEYGNGPHGYFTCTYVL